jgi:hypothetical protein
MKYLVSGYCFVPVRARMVVRASSPEAAIRVAKRRFKKNKSRYIQNGSEDENAAHGWEPFAEETNDQLTPTI